MGYLKEIIAHAQYLGTPYVISRDEPFNTYSDWVHHPKNKTEEGFEECRKVIADLSQFAYDHGAVFLLETYVNNVVGSVEETVKMFAQVDHTRPRPVDGPDQLFETHNIDRMDEILNQVFDTLQDKIKIGHAKDVKRSGDDKSEKHADIGDETRWKAIRSGASAKIELPAPGLGSLNYDLYLKLLSRKHPNIPVIIEHLEEPTCRAPRNSLTASSERRSLSSDKAGRRRSGRSPSTGRQTRRKCRHG